MPRCQSPAVPISRGATLLGGDSHDVGSTRRPGRPPVCAACHLRCLCWLRPPLPSIFLPGFMLGARRGESPGRRVTGGFPKRIDGLGNEKTDSRRNIGSSRTQTPIITVEKWVLHCSFRKGSGRSEFANLAEFLNGAMGSPEYYGRSSDGRIGPPEKAGPGTRWRHAPWRLCSVDRASGRGRPSAQRPAEPARPCTPAGARCRR